MKIIELQLNTNDIKSTTKFYTSILNFKVLEKSEVKVVFKVGESKLIFELSSESIKPKYHFAFNIPSNQIEAAMEWLSNRIKLIEKDDGKITHFENWNAKAIYFYDNNGNLLEFITREALNNSSSSSFSSDSILCINEVGIVDEAPLLLSETIRSKIGAEYFIKGPKREDFVAFGDEQGLFVISRNDRNWYPTNELATKYTLSTKIQVENKFFLLNF